MGDLPPLGRRREGISMIDYKTFDDSLLISVCDRFLEKDASIMDIVRWLQDEHGIPVKRENIYPLLREARNRGYLSILPPPERYLHQRICDRFDAKKDRIHVLRVRGATARDYVANAAAEYIVKLIHEVGETKERARIGLGGGGTIMRVARALAPRLRSEGSLPKLGLHAVSSGFDVNNPWTAPVSFLGYFDQAAPDIEYVGLFASAIVDANEYDHVKTLPGVEESFLKAKEIDIVVTSLAAATDEHGELNRFLNVGEKKAQGVEALRRSGWVGDVSYRPYSNTEPITKSKAIRAVSLFELKDLVELANQPNKHVVLVAAPCGICNEPKGEALRPLLQERNLRLWTHLFMDLTTAQSLLPKET
jgi:DNA-binding transcriptional regulator LsrR (DeoR family)